MDSCQLGDQMNIITINKSNVEEYDHCLIKNQTLPGYAAKSAWVKDQLKNGLVTKRMVTHDGKAVGFIEYIPIENAWRAVEGKNYLFIHCIFTYPKAFQGQDVGEKLVKECIKEAKNNKKDGVAVLTSKNSFIADNRLFEKLGFVETEEINRHQLMVLKLKQESETPRIRDVQSLLEKCKGLHLFYTDQCPALAKPVREIAEACKEERLDLKVHYLKSPKEAQNTPFISGTFAVIYDGKVYGERCISKTRFMNIVKQVGLV